MNRIASRRLAAFTLVELLVVTGIAVILVALLLSAITWGRAAASKAACANNLRQMWHGLFAYNQEYRGLPGTDVHKTFSDLPSFVDVLTKRQGCPDKLFICPASELDHPASYELNLKVVGQPLSKLRADLILASESGGCAQCHNGSTSGFGHGSALNHLFVDGHVEALPRSAAAAAVQSADRPVPPS